MGEEGYTVHGSYYASTVADSGHRKERDLEKTFLRPLSEEACDLAK